MLTKKNVILPYGFKPTDKQKRRLNNGCVVRKCKLCGAFFTTYVTKMQELCMPCYTRFKPVRPVKLKR